MSQPAQMRIGDEARHAQGLAAHAQQRRDIERFELRIDGHAIALAQQAFEADRLAVDQHQFNLGVRHT